MNRFRHATLIVGCHGNTSIFQHIGSIVNQKSGPCPFEQIQIIIVIANGQNMRTFGALGRFLKDHNDALYGERPIYADVAVLRSWPSMAYNCANWLHGPFICEQGLWEARIPFGIVFDRNLDDLSAYRVVLLANQDALSDDAIDRLKRFVEGGGGVVATDATGQRDDWRRPRRVNALTEAFGVEAGTQPVRVCCGKGRVVYLPRLEPPTEFRAGESLRGSHADTALPPKNWRTVEAELRWAAGGCFRFAVEGPHGLAAEFRQGPTPRDRVVHLLNLATKPLRGRIRVEMADEGQDWTLEMASPDPLPRRVPTLARRKGRVAFVVPRLAVYTAYILRPVGRRHELTINKDEGLSR